MPGKQVKDWGKYHALRKKGMSKQSAAKITNASMSRHKMLKGMVAKHG